MNSISWEIARRALIDSGLTDFTDGDIIRKYHEMESKTAKDADDASKALLDSALSIEAKDHVDSEEVEEKSGFKNWFSKNIA